MFIDCNCGGALYGSANRIDNGVVHHVISGEFLNKGNAIIGVNFVSLDAHDYRVNSNGFYIDGCGGDITSPLMNAYIQSVNNGTDIDVCSWDGSISERFCGCSGIVIKELEDSTTPSPDTTTSSSSTTTKTPTNTGTVELSGLVNNPFTPTHTKIPYVILYTEDGNVDHYKYNATLYDNIMLDNNTWYTIPKNCLIINDRIMPCYSSDYWLSVKNEKIYVYTYSPVNQTDIQIGVLNNNYVFELTNNNIDLDSLKTFDHSTICVATTPIPDTTTLTTTEPVTTPTTTDEPATATPTTTEPVTTPTTTDEPVSTMTTTDEPVTTPTTTDEPATATLTTTEYDSNLTKIVKIQYHTDTYTCRPSDVLDNIEFGGPENSYHYVNHDDDSRKYTEVIVTDTYTFVPRLKYPVKKLYADDNLNCGICYDNMGVNIAFDNQYNSETLWLTIVITDEAITTTTTDEATTPTTTDEATTPTTTEVITTTTTTEEDTTLQQHLNKDDIDYSIDDIAPR